MKVWAGTDIGKAREMNQDYYYISEMSDNPQIYLLADGMGGYAGGEIASKLSIQSAKQYILENWERTAKNEKEIIQLLKEATEYSNKVVYEEAKKSEGFEEMGTTLEICLIYENNMYISHIGDSRIYLITEDEIQAITKDQSYVQKLLDDGTITLEEAKNHPKKHMLMKALGCDDNIDPDLIVRKWNENEFILICSDGLTNMLSNEEIQNIVINQINPDKMLIKAANDAGGLDNITVVLIKQ